MVQAQRVCPFRQQCGDSHRSRPQHLQPGRGRGMEILNWNAWGDFLLSLQQEGPPRGPERESKSLSHGPMQSEKTQSTDLLRPARGPPAHTRRRRCTVCKSTDTGSRPRWRGRRFDKAGSGRGQTHPGIPPEPVSGRVSSPRRRAPPLPARIKVSAMQVKTTASEIGVLCNSISLLAFKLNPH